jgi:hypothetical protein
MVFLLLTDPLGPSKPSQTQTPIHRDRGRAQQQLYQLTALVSIHNSGNRSRRLFRLTVSQAEFF